VQFDRHTNTNCGGLYGWLHMLGVQVSGVWLPVLSSRPGLRDAGAYSANDVISVY
jgi:hypothetical protein